MNPVDKIANVSCIVCGSTKVIEQTEKAQVVVRGRTATYQEVFSRCANCGHEFVTSEQAASDSQARESAFEEAGKGPSPATIRKLRCALQLTQPQLERAFGIGPKTVVRWEKGTVTPGGAAQSLFWLMQYYPVVFSKLAEANGVHLPPIVAAASQIRLTTTQVRGTIVAINTPMSPIQKATDAFIDNLGASEVFA